MTANEYGIVTSQDNKFVVVSEDYVFPTYNELASM